MDAMLLKVPDVVARLGVSRAKVYELMASGELTSVRVGGSRRIRAADLEMFVAGLGGAWPEPSCFPSRGTSPQPSPSHSSRVTSG